MLVCQEPVSQSEKIQTSRAPLGLDRGRLNGNDGPEQNPPAQFGPLPPLLIACP